LSISRKVCMDDSWFDCFDSGNFTLPERLRIFKELRSWSNCMLFVVEALTGFACLLEVLGHLKTATTNSMHNFHKPPAHHIRNSVEMRVWVFSLNVPIRGKVPHGAAFPDAILTSF